MAAKNNNKQQQLPPTTTMYLKFWDQGECHSGYLINNFVIGRDMGRPRKQPARIMTANLPLTTWDEMDALRLTNRSVWLNRVILDEIARETTNRDMYEERIAASREEITVMMNPAAKIDQIPTKTLAATLLARIPMNDDVTGAPCNRQVRKNLVKIIRSEQE